MEFDFNEGVYEGLSTSGTEEYADYVGYSSVAADMWQLPESELLLGLGGEYAPVTVDLASDTPHVLVSAGSGAGKSVIARSLATQALLKGFQVVILDTKQISHMWAEGLPGVHVARTAAEVGNAITSLGMEVHRRMRSIRNSPFGMQEDVGPRVLVIYEEMNSTVDMLKELDKSLPPRGVYKSQQAFGDIMNLGRAAKMHVVGFAQYADAHTVPTRWRESFGYRILIRWSSNQWNMLAWQVGYCPPASRHPGRGVVVVGDRALGTQFLYLEEEHCAALVREHRQEASAPSRRERRRMARESQAALTQATGLE
jgi:hypothetical protein